MSTTIPFIPCVFGTTQGFELLPLVKLPFEIEDLLVAINRSEVVLTDEAVAFKIFRIKIRNEVHTWVGLYSKTYEMGFTREGGYYGAGVWLLGTVVNSRLLYDLLVSLAEQVENLAIKGGRFYRPLSQIASEIQPPRNFAEVRASAEPLLRGGLSADSSSGAFVCQPQSTREILDWAQRNKLAENFRAIIISSAENFPKTNPSNRIERFDNIAMLERKVESDLSLQISRLQAERQDLQALNAKLEGELKKAKRMMASGAGYADDAKGARSKSGSGHDRSSVIGRLVVPIALALSLTLNLILVIVWMTAEPKIVTVQPASPASSAKSNDNSQSKKVQTSSDKPVKRHEDPTDSDQSPAPKVQTGTIDSDQDPSKNLQQKSDEAGQSLSGTNEKTSPPVQGPNLPILQSNDAISNPSSVPKLICEPNGMRCRKPTQSNLNSQPDN